MNMVPYIHSNDDVGYVQARWVFTNPEESLLTKVSKAVKLKENDAIDFAEYIAGFESIYVALLRIC